MRNRQMVTIFFVMVVNMLSFSLVVPLLPYYAEKFGASEAVVGLLVGAFAGAQLLATPILGRLSDQFGRRPVLLVSIAGTALGLFILGIANALWILFLGRLLDGITGGNISVARAYVTDITDSKNRSRGLGMLGAAFALGFILGPAMGGILSSGGRYDIPMFVASGLALLNLVTVYAYLPESLTEARKAAAKAQPQTGWLVMVRGWAGQFRRAHVGTLLTIRLVFGTAFTMMTTLFALFTLKQLDMTSTETGLVLAFVGFLLAAVQGYGVGKLAERYSDEQLLVGGLVVITPSLLAWAFTPNVVWLLVVMIPFSLSAGVINTTLTSALTKAVSPQEVGEILGVAGSIESFTRVFSPSVGGIILGQIGTWSPGVLGAILAGLMILYGWQKLLKEPTANPEKSQPIFASQD